MHKKREMYGGTGVRNCIGGGTKQACANALKENIARMASYQLTLVLYTYPLLAMLVIGIPLDITLEVKRKLTIPHSTDQRSIFWIS